MLGLCGMLEFKLCCEILLLLNVADMGRLLCVRLWSEQSWVHCSHMDSLSACGEFCGVQELAKWHKM